MLAVGRGGRAHAFPAPLGDAVPRVNGRRARFPRFPPPPTPRGTAYGKSGKGVRSPLPHRTPPARGARGHAFHAFHRIPLPFLSQTHPLAQQEHGEAPRAVTPPPGGGRNERAANPAGLRPCRIRRRPPRAQPSKRAFPPSILVESPPRETLRTGSSCTPPPVMKKAPSGIGSSERSRPPWLEAGAALTLAWRSVIGAGFALPRDAGRRPPSEEVAGALGPLDLHATIFGPPSRPV